MKKSHLLMCVVLLGASSGALASDVEIPNTFEAGQAAVAADVNENFTALETAVNDNDARLDSAETAIVDTDARADTNEAEITTLQGSVSALEAHHPSGLTQVEYLSWEHNGTLGRSAFMTDGIVIWFTGGVAVPVEPGLVIELLSLDPNTGAWEKESDLEAYAVSDVAVNEESIIESFTAEPNPRPEIIRGLQIIRVNFMDAFDAEGTYKFVIRGDFLADENGRMLDGNFLGGVTPTGDGIEGGLFESWFRVVP